MPYISRANRRRVAESARHRCGYCLTSQELSGGQMHIEHLVPLAQGGNSEETDLWLSCAWCNSYKGSKTHAVDPESAEDVPLFNPRTQSWSEHFRWSRGGTQIEGLTATGRARVLALRLNNAYLVSARRQWVLAGWHPPVE